MSTPVVGKGASNLHSAGAATPSLNLKKKIEAITAEQIDVLGKAMITRIMLRLNIDIEHSDINTDTITHTSSTKFDANSKIFNALLDCFKVSITNAFSTPSLFIEKGVKLSLLAKDKSGFLDQISDEELKLRINKAHQGYPNSSLDIVLSVWSKKNHLYFDITTLGNLLFSSTLSNSIEEYEALLKNGEVF